ncbi:hypothetical protein [Lachnoanaerobaculum sp. OBRC5-5]|uniref:hypothetical protein n=1 Tax=Lachnoanaerobaculum sp. OBRC5-5 TaxID=936595 RepID=UPI00028251FC|nr:hypothetical protein [Lachnoanaerobaculum sp. OBRC5-5]EJZ70644.1 hypothetical protein HMPREF1135_00907 [Lachnoanaerobaculum sp. OBRC5-5]
MWRTGILRKRIRANKEDMEKVINILMSMGYTHCSIHDSNDLYWLSASILEDDDESNIKKRVYYPDVSMFLVERDREGVYKFFYPRENCYYYAYIYFDDIKEKELKISEFLYRYFKLFPEDIFLNESGYVYTKEDIEKAYCNKDLSWIYSSPDAL